MDGAGQARVGRKHKQGALLLTAQHDGEIWRLEVCGSAQSPRQAARKRMRRLLSLALHDSSSNARGHALLLTSSSSELGLSRAGAAAAEPPPAAAPSSAASCHSAAPRARGRGRGSPVGPPHLAPHAAQSLQQHRRYSSGASAWDLPARRAQLAEALLVGSLLPNRAAFSAQLGPHGLQMIPKAVVQLRQQKQQLQQLLKSAGLEGIAIRRRPATAVAPKEHAAAPAPAAAAPVATSSVRDEEDDDEEEEEQRGAPAMEMVRGSAMYLGPMCTGRGRITGNAPVPPKGPERGTAANEAGGCVPSACLSPAQLAHKQRAHLCASSFPRATRRAPTAPRRGGA